MESHQLQFSDDATCDENLCLAVKILNNYLLVESFSFIFKTNYHIDFEISKKKLNEIKILYASHEKKDKDADYLAWTDRCLDPKIIFINQIFRQRLDYLKNGHKKTKKKETEIIVVFFSFLLIHELGHLLLRWKGELNSPTTFGEAGFFLENKLFGGTVQLLIIPSKDWSVNSECIGIAINKPLGYKELDAKILSYQKYIHKIYNMTLSFDIYVNPVYLKKPIEKGARAMKQADEEVEIEEQHADYITLESLGILKCGLQKH
ncbi:CRN domain-containing -containing [Brachionus plicatilis]|uniref:CRN domain-containing-containing n=1 Tax=Brachionus plicatilis TaxID=10195 RepID=A0A3M7STZ1_BRAPC|nr:CRN domain-containing -containing [Brachionus plicatilis]